MVQVVKVFLKLHLCLLAHHQVLSDSVPVASSAGRSIRNNLAELQQRFPTSRGRLASYSSGVSVLGTTTGRPTGSAQPYLQAHLHSGQQARGSRRTPYSIYPQSRTNRPRVRRPSKELVSKDVYILDFGAYRIPTRGERGILEQAGRVISGFEVNKEWDNVKLTAELLNIFPDYCKEAGFEFVKNCGGSVVRPNLPPNRTIDSGLLLKSVAPYGAIYLRLLTEFQPSQSGQMKITDCIDLNSLCGSLNSDEINNNDHGNNSSDNSFQNREESERIRRQLVNNCIPKSPFDIDVIIDEMSELTDPVEILRYLQKKIVEGRALEITAEDDILEGETNFITIDRDNILETTFSELGYVKNPRLTFQVDFMTEEACDLGGPRKEWSRAMNQSIRRKYFDNGFKDFLSNDYFRVGQMIGIAMLQNGQLPNYLNEELLTSITQASETNQCIIEMQKGLQTLGMLTVFRRRPIILRLLRPGAQKPLTVQSLLQLLKARFSEEGSNACKWEKELYARCVKYVREVAAGRRKCGKVTLELGHILAFATGSAEEPVLGFEKMPALHFLPPHENKVTLSLPDAHQGANDSNENSSEESSKQCQTKIVPSFVPVVRTCTNCLELPSALREYPLPPEEELYNVYDNAFAQSYFGVQ